MPFEVFLAAPASQTVLTSILLSLSLANYLLFVVAPKVVAPRRQGSWGRCEADYPGAALVSSRRQVRHDCRSLVRIRLLLAREVAQGT